MLDVLNDFDTRIREVENYFAHVTRLDDGAIELSPAPAAGHLPAIDKDVWIKTLKASCFLLMYNVVESTTKNAIQAIFDDLGSNTVEFDLCRREVRKIVLTNLKRASIDKAVPALSRISVDIVVKTFDKNELFSGNLDAKKIREVTRDYGIKNPRGDGSQLLPIKTNRNDLAHGNKSFDEVGREYSSAQLNLMLRDLKRYMSSFLINVDEYISNKEYLVPAVA